ncbi:MAG: DEAD/DEAH box helicase [Clostridiales bacterium]|nr:DEAD/DEAH box helicase [Clostridiales bacterium]
MLQTPFHAYYTARLLENLPNEDKLVPVFASSDIQIYPFQVAAASFAMRSPYQKGVILCDEAGMGKTHEAMLVVVQKWLEGTNRILIAVPNADLLMQWIDTIDRCYTIPYVVLTNREDWNQNITDASPNAFEQNAVILTTYNFLADQQEAAKDIKWNLTVFEEASALSSVCNEDNKQAKILKDIAEDSFKILLTGTPIEKNIMDLYGLMYFIDETVLPDAETYKKRYLRKPENYPELAERVSKYCFRTLRAQAKQYAKIPERIHITYEYDVLSKERELSEMVLAYANKTDRIAMPELDNYRSTLKLLGYSGSSTVAVLHTIKREIKQIQNMEGAESEVVELRKMVDVAESITIDNKAKMLLLALRKLLPILKKFGANKKALIFTESVETQKYLYHLLKEKYKTHIYNGSADYSVIKEFKKHGEILLSTDNGARGFDLQESALVINYDLPYNTLKMEQRIDRCHRLDQQNDVLVLTFIDKNNYADVRKLQLVNKRHILADGVFGVSDAVIGGFTDDLNAAISEFTEKARTKEQIQTDYLDTLDAHEEENRQLVFETENILFTTFTRELAGKVKVTPKYVEEKAREYNAQLWKIVKSFFEQYNATHSDCYYEINDTEQTITATNYTELPMLFYYWSNGGSRQYKSQKKYGMASDFKPKYGRITLSSILGRGILHHLECADEGIIAVDADIPSCQIALYAVEIKPHDKEYAVLIGKTDTGEMLPEDECRRILTLPVISYTEGEHKTVHWLKGIAGSSRHELDRCVNTDELLQKEAEQLTPLQAEEVDRMKLQTAKSKSALCHAVDALEKQVKTVESELAGTDDRLLRLKLQKQINTMQKEFMQKQETQFFEEMQLDLKLEKDIEAFLGKEKPTARVTREFILKVEGNHNG